MKDICERKQSLFHQWQDAMETYSKAVALLTGTIGKVEEPEYSKVKRRAEIARNLVEQAREELSCHIAMHGC
jgi:hypothetical protein